MEGLSFLIYLSNVWLYAINHVCLASQLRSRLAVVRPSEQLSNLHGENLSIGHYVQAFQPNSFIPVIYMYKHH